MGWSQRPPYVPETTKGLNPEEDGCFINLPAICDTNLVRYSEIIRYTNNQSKLLSCKHVRMLQDS
jgi:hypothetical protein